MKSILIISFYFPPYPKVGSRRWVKFAKYLYRAKKKVHVLAAKMDVDKISPWDHDAKEIEQLTTRLLFKYKMPYYKTVTPVGFAAKTLWHISKLFSTITARDRILKGNPNDISEQYAPAFIKKAKELIEEKDITTIIFTASPNHLAFHISELKNEFPDIKFIFDLRDYWSDWMKHLPENEFAYEALLEKKTILNADVIITPAEKIQQALEKKYPSKATVLHTLPHAYDADDFELGVWRQKTNTFGIHLVYAGTMYPGMERNMKVLLTLLNENKEFDLTFYTFTNDYKDIFSELINSGRIAYKKPLNIKEFTDVVQKSADALLYMRSDLNDDNNFLSSKFFDFLPFKKPIIYLGKKGDASYFIETNGIGFHLTDQNIPDFKLNFDKSTESALHFDNELYSFKNVTQQLIEHIEN